MLKEIPESKWRRTAVGGKTAIDVSGKVLTYLVKKPFLSSDEQKNARTTLDQKNAETIFKALSLLKGTALKLGQMLSFELDMVPSEIRKELEKSYNQVPPINRALVRKIVTNTFHIPPERIFGSFDSKAFAAASLGQVHRAASKDGKPLAVKIQYPGVRNTIKSDLKLVQTMTKPIPEAREFIPMLKEIEQRLMEETDYMNEAENARFFKIHLKMDNVVIPGIVNDLTRDTVLCMEFIEGMSLDHWIKTNPDQIRRDQVAQTLNDLFLKSVYELNLIHADPNPGNFIIMDDFKVGLVDYGCVKKLPPELVEGYRNVITTQSSEDPEKYFALLQKLGIFKCDIKGQPKKEILSVLKEIARWMNQIYEEEYFDFKANSQFISDGKVLFSRFFKYRKYFQGNPDAIFLDRTQYGLFRIYEKLQAKVKMRNSYEFIET